MKGVSLTDTLSLCHREIFLRDRQEGIFALMSDEGNYSFVGGGIRKSYILSFVCIVHSERCKGIGGFKSG